MTGVVMEILSGGAPPFVQHTYNAHGTFTETIPAGYNFMDYEGWQPGAGGGGFQTGVGSFGGGGGAGGYSSRTNVSIAGQAGKTINVTIGQGGAHGTNGSAPTNGSGPVSSTSITSGTFTLPASYAVGTAAAGGINGQGAATGGAGGTQTGGTTNTTGGAGTNGGGSAGQGGTAVAGLHGFSAGGGSPGTNITIAGADGGASFYYHN